MLAITGESPVNPQNRCHTSLIDHTGTRSESSIEELSIDNTRHEPTLHGLAFLNLIDWIVTARVRHGDFNNRNNGFGDDRWRTRAFRSGGTLLSLQRGIALFTASLPDGAPPWQLCNLVAQVRVLTLSLTLRRQSIFVLESALLILGLDGWVSNPDVHVLINGSYRTRMLPAVNVGPITVAGVKARTQPSDTDEPRHPTSRPAADQSRLDRNPDGTVPPSAGSSRCCQRDHA